MSEEYKRVHGGKDETPESKLALANINQIVERMIDGYARAVALAGSDAQFATQKTVWMESLTTWYKYLNPTDAQLTGMNQLIASVLSKPLPPEPTPIVSLPTAAPAATPIGTTGGAGNGAPANPGTTTPAKGNGTTPASTAPATSTPTKPASTKPGTPDRPRNR
jgi:hypothetical protein